MYRIHDVCGARLVSELVSLHPTTQSRSLEGLQSLSYLSVTRGQDTLPYHDMRYSLRSSTKKTSLRPKKYQLGTKKKIWDRDIFPLGQGRVYICRVFGTLGHQGHCTFRTFGQQRAWDCLPALKACWVIPLRGWKPTRIEAHKNQAHKNRQTDKNRAHENREVTVFMLDSTLVCSFCSYSYEQNRRHSTRARREQYRG